MMPNFSFHFQFRYWILLWIFLSLGTDGFAKIQTPIHIPNYEVIQQMRTAFYQLRFSESRAVLQQLINQTEVPIQATYQTIFHYLELTSLLGTNDSKHYQSFEQQSDKALQQLTEFTKKEPDNPVWQIYLGMVYGLKSGVAMAFHRSYFKAYYYGITGVNIFETIKSQYPQFYDVFLSTGILKIMIVQSSWLIRTVAPILLPVGSLEEGTAHLDLVIQRGTYAREEGRLVHLFLTWGKVPSPLRVKSIRQLLVLLKKYPENIQLYYFIAKGYWQMGRYRQANQYAIQGLRQLSQQHTQFIDQHRIALKAHLLRYQYRYLGIKEKWPALLAQTKRNHDPSGVSQAYHAYALRKLNRTHAAVDLAQEVLANLKKENLSMPFFVSPYSLSMEDSLKRFVQKYILKE